MTKAAASICGPSVPICGSSRAYYYGDPKPPRGAGYGEFVEWREAQFNRKRRKKSKHGA